MDEAPTARDARTALRAIAITRAASAMATNSVMDASLRACAPVVVDISRGLFFSACYATWLAP